jgi:hypothetical protein
MTLEIRKLSKSTRVSFFIGNITAASGGKDIGCLAASRDTGKGFLVDVEKRNSETLEEIIQA